MTKTLFIEVRDERGLTEIWDPDEATMGELGWCRVCGNDETGIGKCFLERGHDGEHCVWPDEPLIPNAGCADDDPEPTRYDEAGAPKANGHHVALHPDADPNCTKCKGSGSVPWSDDFVTLSARPCECNRKWHMPQGVLLTDRLAQLLPAELDKRKDEGAVMATVAVLIEVLSEKMGRVF